MANTLKPYLNIPPGRFIQEELDVRNWRQEDLAEILGMSLKSINKLIKNKQSITFETARLLSKAFGQSPQYWINLDANYRLRLQGEQMREANVAAKAQIYQRMPVKDLIQRKWLSYTKDTDQLVMEVKKFWSINNLDFSFMDRWPFPSLRMSDAFDNYNKHYILTWFWMAQKCSKIYQVGRYREAPLRRALKDFTEYSNSQRGIKDFISVLNGSGVKFFVLPHLPKTYTYGASFWDDSNPVIAYTARYHTIDNFWFTLAHEIAHILLHLKDKSRFFIDDRLEQGTTPEGSAKEDKANDFAISLLKVDEILAFFRPYNHYISRLRVEDCSRTLRLHPGIIVGVLQHHGILLKRNLNEYKKNVYDFIPAVYLVEKRIEEVRRIKIPNKFAF